MANLPLDWGIHHSPGGSQDAVGFDKFCRLFVKNINHTRRHQLGTQSGRELVFLFFDGHDSRWTYSGLSFLAANDVTAFCLPSHTTILTQPNDNGTNREIHKACGRYANEWRSKYLDITMVAADVNIIMAKAWYDATKMEAVTRESFKRTCIYPLNRNASNYDARHMRISTIYNRKSPKSSGILALST